MLGGKYEVGEEDWVPALVDLGVSVVSLVWKKQRLLDKPRIYTS